MSIVSAILSCASSSVVASVATEAWQNNAQTLEDIGITTDRRRASIIGQCAHESMGFRTRYENLNYSGDGLWRIFRKYFKNRAEADGFARQPEKIANRVYANRMGNGDSASGDGWRYRGRGFIQLTGRDNYRIYGDLLGINLIATPEVAAEPDLCWLIAAQFMARTRRSNKTLLEWADVPDTVLVTKGINGGTHGLQDRQHKTAIAFEALTGEATTAEWQALLLNAGFDPGPVDGLEGPKTRAAVAAAEAQFNLTGDALIAHLRTIV